MRERRSARRRRSRPSRRRARMPSRPARPRRRREPRGTPRWRGLPRIRPRPKLRNGTSNRRPTRLSRGRMRRPSQTAEPTTRALTRRRHWRRRDGLPGRLQIRLPRQDCSSSPSLKVHHSNERRFVSGSVRPRWTRTLPLGLATARTTQWWRRCPPTCLPRCFNPGIDARVRSSAAASSPSR